jgi:hypothetical protein
MKTALIFALIITLFLTSCSTYRQAGEGGCYFKQNKSYAPKNVVRIR